MAGILIGEGTDAQEETISGALEVGAGVGVVLDYFAGLGVGGIVVEVQLGFGQQFLQVPEESRVRVLGLDESGLSHRLDGFCQSHCGYRAFGLSPLAIGHIVVIGRILQPELGISIPTGG